MMTLTPIFVSIAGDLDSAKIALRNEGYSVGDFEDSGDGTGNLEVCQNCIGDLREWRDLELEYQGTILQASWL